MKTKILLIISTVAMCIILLCSCSTDSMRSARNTVRNTTRRAENYLDNGVNAVPNNLENGRNTMIGNGMTYGANSGYNAGAGIGTGYTYNYNGKKMTGNVTTRTNPGMINTNKGASDGGIK